jgi:hypothetical protein
LDILLRVRLILPNILLSVSESELSTCSALSSLSFGISDFTLTPFLFNIASSPEIFLFLLSVLRAGICGSVAGLTGEPGVGAVVFAFVKSISTLSASAALVCLQ